VVSGAPSLSTHGDDGQFRRRYAIIPILDTLSTTNYSFSFTNGTLT